MLWVIHRSFENSLVLHHATPSEVTWAACTSRECHNRFHALIALLPLPGVDHRAMKKCAIPANIFLYDSNTAFSP